MSHPRATQRPQDKRRFTPPDVAICVLAVLAIPAAVYVVAHFWN